MYLAWNSRQLSYQNYTSVIKWLPLQWRILYLSCHKGRCVVNWCQQDPWVSINLVAFVLEILLACELTNVFTFLMAISLRNCSIESNPLNDSVKPIHSVNHSDVWATNQQFYYKNDTFTFNWNYTDFPALLSGFISPFIRKLAVWNIKETVLIMY